MQPLSSAHKAAEIYLLLRTGVRRFKTLATSDNRQQEPPFPPKRGHCLVHDLNFPLLDYPSIPSAYFTGKLLQQCRAHTSY